MIAVNININCSLTIRNRPIDCPSGDFNLIKRILVSPRNPHYADKRVKYSRYLASSSVTRRCSTVVNHTTAFSSFTRSTETRIPRTSRLIRHAYFQLKSLLTAITGVTVPKRMVVTNRSTFLTGLNASSLHSNVHFCHRDRARPIGFAVVSRS